MSSPLSSSSSETILDAAESLVCREGVSRLTFEAVATEAGVSKGGVLHYFSNKDQLIEAMVQRSARHWRECYLGAYEATPEGPGRMTRAILNHCLLGNDSWTDQVRRSFSSVVAALVHDPSLVHAMRDCHTELNHLLQNDGLPAGVGEVVGAAIDGLWLNWAMRFREVSPEILARLHGALEMMLEQTLPQENLAKPSAGRKIQKKKA